MKIIVLIEEIPRRVNEGHQLAEDCRNGGALDSHIQHEYENRVHYGVRNDRGDSQFHRQFRISGSADHVVQSEIKVRDDIAQQYYDHVVSCKGQCVLTRAEEHEYRVEKRQRHH